MLKTLLKTLFWLMVLSVVTVVALLYFVPRHVPQEKLHAVLEETYNRITHKRMKILGRVDIAFIPEAYVSLTDVNISDPATPEATPTTLRSALVKFDLRRALSEYVAISFTAEADGQKITGKADFPTSARFNRGGINTAAITLEEPFALSVKGKVQGSPVLLSLKDVEIAFAQTRGSGSLEGHVKEEGDDFKGNWEFTVLDIDELARVSGGIMAAWELFRPAPAPAPAPAPQQPAEGTGPEAPQESLPQVPAVNASPWSDKLLNLGWIRGTMAEVAFNVGQLRYHGVTHENVNTKLEVTRGQLSFAINQAKLFGGEGSASLLIDITTAVPFYQKNIALHGANIGQFLRDVYQLDGVEGTGDVTVEVNATGYSWQQVIGTMSGKGSITLKDGLLKGVDVLGMANSTPEAVRKAFYEGDNDTKIIDASATFTMTEGIFANNDLVMNVPFLRLTGRGTLDFLEMSIKYKVTPIIGAERIGLSVPLLLSGSLAHPDVLPEVAGIAPSPAVAPITP